MSFEVFLDCFTSGEPDGVPAADVERIFGPHVQVGENGWWRVFYDEQNQCEILVGSLPSDPSLLTSLCVLRPCADPRLWEALFSVLKVGHFVLYFPAETAPLVIADESVAEHLPKDMLASMGTLTCVTSAQEICEVIRKA
jgi:hypothetical protein